MLSPIIIFSLIVQSNFVCAVAKEGEKIMSSFLINIRLGRLCKEIKEGGGSIET